MVFVLDREGGAEVLKVNAAQAIAELAQQVADKASPNAVVEISTTDRARARVKVPAAEQAKDGVLSRAASEAGLAVQPFKNTRPAREPSADKKPARKRGRPRKTTNT